MTTKKKITKKTTTPKRGTFWTQAFAAALMGTGGQAMNNMKEYDEMGEDYDANLRHEASTAVRMAETMADVADARNA